MAVTHFNPDQPRDKNGKWVKGAAGLVHAVLNAVAADGKAKDFGIKERNAARKALEGQTEVLAASQAPKSESINSQTVEQAVVKLETVATQLRQDAVGAGKKGLPKVAQQKRKKARALEAASKAISKHGVKDTQAIAPATQKDTPTVSKTQTKSGGKDWSKVSHEVLFKPEGLNAKRNVKQMADSKLDAIIASSPKNSDEKALIDKAKAEKQNRLAAHGASPSLPEVEPPKAEPVHKTAKVGPNTPDSEIDALPIQTRQIYSGDQAAGGPTEVKIGKYTAGHVGRTYSVSGGSYTGKFYASMNQVGLGSDFATRQDAIDALVAAKRDQLKAVVASKKSDTSPSKAGTIDMFPSLLPGYWKAQDDLFDDSYAVAGTTPNSHPTKPIGFVAHVVPDPSTSYTIPADKWIAISRSGSMLTEKGSGKPFDSKEAAADYLTVKAVPKGHASSDVLLPPKSEPVPNIGPLGVDKPKAPEQATTIKAMGDGTYGVFKGDTRLGRVRKKGSGYVATRMGKQVAQGSTREEAMQGLIDHLAGKSTPAAAPEPPPTPQGVPDAPPTPPAPKPSGKQVTGGFTVGQKVRVKKSGGKGRFRAVIQGEKNGKLQVQAVAGTKHEVHPADVSEIKEKGASTPSVGGSKKVKAPKVPEGPQGHGDFKEGQKVEYIDENGAHIRGNVSGWDDETGMLSLSPDLPGAAGQVKWQVHHSLVDHEGELIDPAKYAKKPGYSKADVVEYYDKQGQIQRGRVLSPLGYNDRLTVRPVTGSVGYQYVSAGQIRGKVYGGPEGKLVVKPNPYEPSRKKKLALPDAIRNPLKSAASSLAPDTRPTGAGEVLGAIANAEHQKTNRLELSRAARAWLLRDGLRRAQERGADPAAVAAWRAKLEAGSGPRKIRAFGGGSLVGNNPLPTDPLDLGGEEVARDAPGFVDQLQRGIDQKQTLKTLDPAEREKQLTEGERIGHAQHLLYDLAIGRQRGGEEPPKVVTDQEYRQRLENDPQSGIKSRDDVAKTVGYKVKIGGSGVGFDNPFPDDPAFKHSVKTGRASIDLPANVSDSDLAAVARITNLYGIAGRIKSWKQYNPGKKQTFLNFARDEAKPFEPIQTGPGSRVEAVRHQRDKEVTKKYDKQFDRRIAKLRKTEGTVPFAFTVPRWHEIQMEKQDWKDIQDHIETAGTGGYVPSFYQTAKTEDGVLYHRRTVTTARVVPDADVSVTEALKKNGAVQRTNSKDIDPGYRGRGEIHPGTMLLLEIEPGKHDPKAATENARKDILREFDEKYGRSAQDLATNEKTLAEFISGKKTPYGPNPSGSISQHQQMVIQQKLRVERLKATRKKIESAPDMTALSSAISTFSFPAGTPSYEAIGLADFKKGAAAHIAHHENKVIGGKRIEYVPHAQGARGAPTSQRGRLTVEGFSPKEATQRLQELGVVGELEPEVPFTSVMRSERRDGLIIPLHPDYLRGDAPPPRSKYLLTHGITSGGYGADSKTVAIVKSVLQGGGLHSIAERFKRGIKVRSSSPAGDIRSGIDHIVFCSLDSGSTCGANSSVKIALKPEAMMRRDVVLAPRDFGGMGSRYEHYKKYANTLRQKAGAPTASLYQPLPPSARQLHLNSKAKSPGSSEFNIGGSIPVEDMAVIGVTSADLAAAVNKILDELMAEGKIAERPQVVIGNQAFRAATHA
jgi:hypothetical protein